MAVHNGLKVAQKGLQAFFFGMLFLSAPAFAFTTTITDSYRISEGETVIMAREKLIEKIKQKASRNAGSYISINKSIDQTNQLKETIDVISATLVKINILNEKNKVVDGAIHLEITAKAEVDESVLKARVNAIKDDSKKRQEILNLASQNKKLLKQLEDLTAALLRKDISKEEVTALIDSKNAIQREINANSTSIEGKVSFNLDVALDDARIQAEQKSLENERKQKEKHRKFMSNAPKIDRKVIELVKSVYGADKLKSIDTKIEEWHYAPQCNPDFKTYLTIYHDLLSRSKSTPEHLKEYLASKFYKDANTKETTKTITPIYGGKPYEVTDITPVKRAYKKHGVKSSECQGIKYEEFSGFYEKYDSIFYEIDATAKFEDGEKKYKELSQLLNTDAKDYSYNIYVHLLANVKPHLSSFHGKEFMNEKPEPVRFDTLRVPGYAAKGEIISELSETKKIDARIARNIDKFQTHITISRKSGKVLDDGGEALIEIFP